MKKFWCKHIHYSDNIIDGNKRYIWWMNRVDNIPPSWKVCPICQAERPTKKNITAAELRFTMDNA